MADTDKVSSASKIESHSGRYTRTANAPDDKAGSLSAGTRIPTPPRAWLFLILLHCCGLHFLLAHASSPLPFENNGSYIMTKDPQIFSRNTRSRDVPEPAAGENNNRRKSYSRVISERIYRTSEDLTDAETLRVTVLLPNDPWYLAALPRVAPAIQMAIEKVRALELLPRHHIAVKMLDSRCSNIYAPYEAMETMCQADEHQQTHVFLGPSCEYSLASVARLLKFWNVPLLTPGGMAREFANRKVEFSDEFYLLVRMGFSFPEYSQFILSIVQRYKWKKVRLFFDNSAFQEVSGDDTCFQLSSTLAKEARTRPEPINARGYRLDDSRLTPLEILKAEAGNEYGSECT